MHRSRCCSSSNSMAHLATVGRTGISIISISALAPGSFRCPGHRGSAMNRAAERSGGTMTAADAIVGRLRAAGCVFAEDEAAVLLASASDPAQLAAMVDQRVAGQPLEHVVGWDEFFGRRILVGPGVFVPRQRTELLVREAVARRGRVVVDLACGCGAVGLAVGGP